jgi:uncharacterized protein
MLTIVALVLLIACCLAGLVLIPLGLPGLWLMALGVIVFGWMTAFRTVGFVTMGVVIGLAVVGEGADWWVGFHMAKRYGGSRRAAWGALLGGLIGAAVGVPVPIVGSVIGALVGAFAGAAALEYTRAARGRQAVSAGWGAVMGRAAATALKVGIGLVIAVVGVFAAARL